MKALFTISYIISCSIIIWAPEISDKLHKRLSILEVKLIGVAVGAIGAIITYSEFLSELATLYCVAVASLIARDYVRQLPNPHESPAVIMTGALLMAAIIAIINIIIK